MPVIAKLAEALNLYSGRYYTFSAKEKVHARLIYDVDVCV